jgi:hypothetical protein
MPRLTLAVLACFGLASPLASAGDLNPPSGPLAPTMKTLQQVEPRMPIDSTNTPGDADSTYRIARPGSYYLTANLNGEFGKNGIKIDSSDVTIDLMGFEVFGVFGSLDAMVSVGGAAGITIRNGRITSWGDEGIDLVGSDNVVIEDVVVTGVAGYGVQTRYSAIIRGCTFVACGASAVQTSEQSIVTDCVAEASAGSGFDLGWGSHIAGCVATNNGSAGIDTGNGTSVVNCSTRGNSGGIRAGEGANISSCTSYQDNGIGILAGEGTTVSGCTVRFSISTGISLDDYAVARGNTVSQSITDGIVVASNCAVIDNTVLEAGIGNGNFGHGIRVTGSDTRIESNQTTDCDVGYKIEGAGNLIIRNSSSGNASHWDIAIGNRLAPIVVGGTNVAPVVGSAYAGGLGTTDPNANFTY